MMRLIFHLMAVCCACFCAALGVLRAQPYDDGGLRTAFATPNCAAPCFLGIRPGVTTGDQAAAILRALPWVAEVQASADRIDWTWNGQQPAFLHTAHNSAQILLRSGVVHWIGIATAAQVADLKIVFGAPDASYYLSQQVRDSSKNYYSAFAEYTLYRAHALESIVYTLCPAQVGSVWLLPVTLSLPDAAAPQFAEVRGAFVPLPETCR
jgi:hypothetical protein